MDEQAVPWRTRMKPGITEQQRERQQRESNLDHLNKRRPMIYRDNSGPDYVPDRYKYDSWASPEPPVRPELPPQVPQYYDQYGRPINFPQQQQQQPQPQQRPMPMQQPMGKPEVPKKRVLLYTLIGVVSILLVVFIISVVIFYMKYGR